MHAKTRGDRQAAGQLARAKHGFQRWRQSPKRSRGIPERLWRMAAKAASIHGLYATAREPRLNATRLKEQLRSLGQDGTPSLKKPVGPRASVRGAFEAAESRTLAQARPARGEHAGFSGGALAGNPSRGGVCPAGRGRGWRSPAHPVEERSRRANRFPQSNALEWVKDAPARRGLSRRLLRRSSRSCSKAASMIWQQAIASSFGRIR